MQIALNLLELPATSASTERSFSTHGRVHSKARNRTKTARAAKLAYLAFNLKASLRSLKKKSKKNQVVVDSRNEIDEDSDEDYDEDYDENYSEDEDEDRENIFDDGSDVDEDMPEM